jgi:hypothetical protein
VLGQKYVAIGISTCNNYVVHAKGGGVFDAVEKARAIYVVKNEE